MVGAADPGATHPVQAATAGVTRARQGRATRSRHAARGGLVSGPGGSGRAAEQAQVWWAEGTERVAARARERWNEQAAGAQRPRPPPPPRSSRLRPRGGASGTASGTGPGTAREPGGLGGRPTSRGIWGAEGRRASWREDLVTGWCSLLLVLGLYLDGWSQGDGLVVG